MADLDLLAVAGKEHRVIAHDIAATDGGKADAAGLARAGVALAGENADFGQRLAQIVKRCSRRSFKAKAKKITT